MVSIWFSESATRIGLSLELSHSDPFGDPETVGREEIVQSGFESSADCFFWDVMSSSDHAGGKASERSFYVGECYENEVGVVAGGCEPLDSSE